MNSASLQADGLPLWSLDVATGEAKRIATTLVNPAYQSWSPDGRKLVFTNGGYRSAQVDKWLSLFNPDTGKVSDLVSKEKLVPGAVAWSPAGDRIAVAAVAGSKTGPEYADDMGWDNPAIAARRIYLVNPERGAYQRLTQSETYEDAPRWSRDGKQLFFVQAEGSQARVKRITLETGGIEAVQDCEMLMPSSAGYYGQVDWSGLYATCAAIQGQVVPDSETSASTPEFALYFYPPLVVDYDPALWTDQSNPDRSVAMVNYLQHRELEQCTIGVRGPSGFYPENMADLVLRDITYEVFEQENAETGTVIKDFFLKSVVSSDVLSEIGIPILNVQSSRSDAQACQAAAESVLATLRPSERLLHMPYCEKLAQEYWAPRNDKTYCDSDYPFAFNYPADWEITLVSSAPDQGTSPIVVRRAQRFSAADGSNFVRADTYRLGAGVSLEDRVKTFFSYQYREFPEKDYAELRIGGKRAYAITNRWVQDISAVYLFFEHGEYYTVLELKAPRGPALDNNWKIARSIQVPGATLDDNFIPEELIQDSHRLLR